MYLSLNQAAKETGKGKGTISKAISSGKLSVVSKDGNSYKIDPAELFRVFPKNSVTTSNQNHLETPSDHPETTIENIRLKAELDVLKAKLEAETARANIFEQAQNDWKKQAQTLLIQQETREASERPVERRKKFLGIF